MLKLKDMKIGTRLGVGFGIIIFIFIGAIVSSSLILNVVDSGTKRVQNETLPSLSHAYELNIGTLEVSEIITDISATHQTEGFKEADKTARTLRDHAAKLKEMYKSQNDTAGVALVEEVEKNFEEFYKDGINMARVYIAKGQDAGNKIMESFDKTRDKLTEAVEKLQKKELEEANTDAQKNVDSVGKVIKGLIFMGVAAIILGILIAVFTTRSIVRPINEAVDVSNKVSQGDLTVNIEVKSKDETGHLLQSIKVMVDKLREMISGVKSSSDNLASASQELSASAEQMSRGLTEQSGRSSQIATAANEMSQTIVDVAKNSSNIATSASETLKIADNGKEIVGKSVDEVKAIAETVSESAKLISSLGERSKQIGEIVNVIKDIADQTNLLALNAAIEAARAGEQGRGFAVVADEVRKLAERTAKATAEIGEMIGAIQVEMDQAVNSMEEGTKRVEIGVQFSAQAGEALRKIVNSVGELQSMVQQIATATEEMSTASEQISTDIETIANVSKETTVSSEQVSGASSDLARLAGNLQGLVAIYKV